MFEAYGKKRGALIIRDKRWYFRLVASDTSSYSKSRALLEDFDISSVRQGLVICFTPQYVPGRDKPFVNERGQAIRIYAYFPSYLHFYDYMMLFPYESRCFYEIVFGELEQKPHFDIDMSIQELSRSYPGEDPEEVAETIRDTLISSIRQEIPELSIEKDILLYSSHNETKKSYHLVVGNRSHSGNVQAKMFYDNVLSRMRVMTTGKYLSFVDQAVYSSKQQFRILGSRKVGSGRPKVFHEQFYYDGILYTHQYREDVSHPETKKRVMLYESLVSFTSGCSLLPHYESRKPVRNYEDAELDEATVRLCMEMLREKFSHCPFSLREVNGGIISLKRSRASMCPLCNKTHENENPFVFIAGKSVYWDCRRSPSNKLLLGYLPISLNDDNKTYENTMVDNDDEVFSFGEKALETLPFETPVPVTRNVSAQVSQTASMWANRKLSQITQIPNMKISLSEWKSGL